MTVFQMIYNRLMISFNILCYVKYDQNYFVDELNHISHALQSYVVFCLCLIIWWQKFVWRQINFYKVSNLRDYPIKNFLLRIKVRIVLYVLTDYATKQNTFNFCFLFLWKNFLLLCISFPSFNGEQKHAKPQMHIDLIII